ncbi:MAG: DUF6263 family protein [Candidatus Kapaibacterium sp.]|jgi:hypothetical protein|nr:hypothetical protein [Candidatus Kapabacteria bacterium]
MSLKNVVIVLFSTFLIYGMSHAQEAVSGMDNNQETPLYRISSRFPVNVSKKYIFTEHTKIKRKFSNGKTQDFSRELTYHFSLRAPDPLSKDGFQNVEVSVDSIEYKFTDADTTIYFNDQRDDLRPPKLEDYQIKVVPLGLNFSYTLSPYYNVAKVGGDMLIQKRDYVSNPKTAPSDELHKSTWVNGLQDESLMNYFDVVKGFPPMNKVGIDSTWSKAIPVEIEGSRFIDSVTFKLDKFNIKQFSISGNSEKMSLQHGLVRIFGLSQLIDFENVTGKSQYTVKMHPKGTVDEFTANYQLEMTYQVANDYIQQEIECNRKWYLEKLYNW